ncbi:MAG: quinol:cytochrome C oxidoreductase [bacterium]|nr:quinol:cytochrome C oxidoreductase [bacterium]
MSLHDPAQLMDERRRLEGLGLSVTRYGGAIGLIGLVLACLMGFIQENGMDRFFFVYLTNFIFFLSISLGALCFTGIQHVTRAGWSIVVRRLMELLAANVVLMAILFIPIIFGLHSLYHWTHAEAVAHDPILQHKAPYLNTAFFLFRAVIFFAVWIGLALFFLRKSTEQDESGDYKISIRLEKVSSWGLFLYAMTTTYASFDWLMSLDPHWYSTIYGVYFFAGSAVALFATLSALCIGLQKSGRLTRAITTEHYHDLGKFLFAFTIFWAYIAFSQYMLYWYANKPETTGWILRRQTAPMLWVSLSLIFCHFFLPFFGLLSRHIKRNKSLLFFWAIWMLVMHWVDIYWLVMPEYVHQYGEIGAAPFGLMDIFCLIGFGGLYAAGFAMWARGRSLIPMKDPRLAESLTFENA